MSSKALRQTHIGHENPTGTATAPTYVIPALVQLRPKPDKVVVDEDIGSLAPARHYIGSLMAEGNLEMDGTYEQAHQVVAMAMGEGTDTPAGGLRQWVFDLPDDTNPTFATFTMEYTDGNTHVVKGTDVFATSLEISGEAGKTWEFKADLEGANVTLPGALTGSLTPLPRTAIRVAETELTIDDSWANLGNTPVGVLISFTWKLEDLQHHKLFAGTLYPTGRGNDKWNTTLELILEVEDATVATEVAKNLNTSLSAIRLAATSGGYVAQINGMYFLSEVSTLDDRDGNNTIKLTYKGQKDSSNNTGNLTFITPLAVL